MHEQVAAVPEDLRLGKAQALCPGNGAYCGEPTAGQGCLLAGGHAIRSLFAVALAVLAPRPAAGPAHAFLELFARAPDAALARGLLLGLLDPADELVAGERRDVLPGVERCRVGDQRLAQVRGQLVHDAAGQSWSAHAPIVF